MSREELRDFKVGGGQIRKGGGDTAGFEQQQKLKKINYVQATINLGFISRIT